MVVNDEFWRFVDEHIGDNADRLRLKYHGRESADFDINLAITQIECRKKFGKKLSVTLAEHPHWLFPSVLSGEQSTSDCLAQYHATLIDEGDSIVDLTSGLGIDVLHLSSKTFHTVAIEIDGFKAWALKQNFKDTDVEVVNADCRDYISRDVSFDVAFIDPARRAEDGSRVYALSQCQPDVVDMLPRLMSVAEKLIVKMSPMLDITHTLRELKNAHAIIALGTETECKELVAIVDLKKEAPNSEADKIDEIEISAVTLLNDDSISDINFTLRQEREVDLSKLISTPAEGNYLYDPYPSVMKAAPFKTLAAKYGVKKISNNTHLYFSEALAAGFPGQAYMIEKIISYNSKYIKRLKKDYPKISVTTRNFDLSADKLKAKLGVTDSDCRRLFAVTLSNSEKCMIITTPT